MIIVFTVSAYPFAWYADVFLSIVFILFYGVSSMM